MTHTVSDDRFDDLASIAATIEPLLKAFDARIAAEGTVPEPVDYDHDFPRVGAEPSQYCERCGCRDGDLTDCPGEWFDFNGKDDYVKGAWV